MLRDLLIGGDQFRVVQNKPARQLWGLAAVWVALAIFSTVLGYLFLPFQIDRVPYILLAAVLGLVLTVGWASVSMLAVVGGEEKAGGAEKQLPLVVAASGAATTAWSCSVGLIALSIYLFETTSEVMGGAFTLFFMVLGVASSTGIMVNTWTHLLKTPFWLAFLLILISAGMVLVGANTVWAFFAQDFISLNFYGSFY